MKKIGTLIFILLLIFPSILAIDLQIEKTSSNEVMIADVNEPAVFDLKVTNFGPTDDFEFYNLLGFSMFPVGTVSLKSGQTKIIQLKISPIGEFNHRGFYTFDYFVRGQDGTQIKNELTFKIIDLEDAFEIGSGEINPESSTMDIYIHNKVNFNFNEIGAKFTSQFFELEENFQLEPNKRKDFSIGLDKKDFEKLIAGFYTLNAEITTGGKTKNIEGIIKFSEKDILKVEEKDYGIILNTNIIKKVNEGNVLVDSETIIKKNIISRLFTNFSPEPDSVERQGAEVYYTWSKSIKPGETLEIVVKTNWLIPLLIIFFVVIIVVLAKQYAKTDLVLRKRVSFVKAKGGEFALKVSIQINAKNYIEKVSLIDRIPQLVKIYNRFGGDHPTRIDEKTKRLEWNFEKLEAGEIRMISYVIYSKVGVLGKFALPTATAIYEREGNIRESQSNKAFFVAEQKGKEIED